MDQLSPEPVFRAFREFWGNGIPNREGLSQILMDKQMVRPDRQDPSAARATAESFGLAEIAITNPTYRGAINIVGWRPHVAGPPGPKLTDASMAPGGG